MRCPTELLRPSLWKEDWMLRFVDRLAQGGRLYALSVVYLALFPSAARGHVIGKHRAPSVGPHPALSGGYQTGPRRGSFPQVFFGFIKLIFGCILDAGHGIAGALSGKDQFIQL